MSRTSSGLLDIKLLKSNEFAAVVRRFEGVVVLKFVGEQTAQAP
jgi:hypothetical protein